MKRFFVLSTVLWLVVSCGGKEEEPKQTGTQTARRGEPVQAIPETELTEFEKLANPFLRPYFDGAGTQTEKTVKPGETFDLYVVAEYGKNFAMCAAEYRLVLPEGMIVSSSANCDSTILTMGRHDEDFSTTFNCTSGPKMWLVRYLCTTDPSFRGGEIRTEQGARMNFLGFTLCDGEFTMVNARAGKATIKVD